jgi:Ca2+-binding RTX toxin-like protein
VLDRRARAGPGIPETALRQSPGTTPCRSAQSLKGLCVMSLILGTNGSDHKDGTDLADTMYAFDGDDELYGKDGNDVFIGGTGK